MEKFYDVYGLVNDGGYCNPMSLEDAVEVSREDGAAYFASESDQRWCINAEPKFLVVRGKLYELTPVTVED